MMSSDPFVPLRFAVAGHPVGHSASPVMHNAALRAMRLPHHYEAIDCPGRGAFERTVKLLRAGYFEGLNVTAPHKRAAAELADRVDASAEQVGAANTLVRRGHVIEAFNTDIPAMIDELQQAAPRLGVALILGSGGAARAALAACQAMGVRLVGVTSRSWTTTEQMFEAESAQFFRDRKALTFPWPAGQGEEGRNRGSMVLQLQWFETAAVADLIIQATSVGRRDDGDEVASLVPWDKVRDGAVTFELNYHKTLTPFEEASARRGLVSIGGLGLLARQGARALSLWLGQPAPYEIMLGAASVYVRG